MGEDVTEILHDFVFNELTKEQIVSLWRFLDPVWNETVREIALALHYRIYLMKNTPFTCQDALKKTGIFLTGSPTGIIFGKTSVIIL